MSGDIDQYLQAFFSKAQAAGFSAHKPGLSWVRLSNLAPNCHVSMSVTRHATQVNLNNEQDGDREIFNSLHRDRREIENAIGEGLDWEKKDGRKKTAIRATLAEGYEDGDWDRQHAWALDKMKMFERVFAPRLR
jgi:hypothetical protein